MYNTPRKEANSKKENINMVEKTVRKLKNEDCR